MNNPPNQIPDFISSILSSNKGSIHTLVIERPIKTLKKFSERNIVKRSKIQARLGHSYYNQKATKTLHESGQREICGLPDWAESINAHLVRNKKTGEIYLRGQPIPSKASHTQYFADGRPVSYEEIEETMQASERRREDGERQDWMYVKIGNVKEIK